MSVELSRRAAAITDLTVRAVREPAGKAVRILVTVKTDAGVSGIGEADGRPDAKTAMSRILARKRDVVGQDALSAEAVQKRLGASPAAAAVNMALLDILGKTAGAPVYEILGGPTRNKARAMAHLHGTSAAALERSLKRAHAAGFRVFRVPLAPPGPPPRGRAFYRQAYGVLDRLRKAAGEDCDFVLDCGGRTKPEAAIGLAREFERFHLLWLEEPCGRVPVRARRKISDETVVPIGYGRDAADNRYFQELLREDAIDILRPDILRLGIGGVRKGAALAETYYVAVAPFNRGGPIATAAALQAAASMPNFFLQEVPTPEDERDLLMRRELTTAPVEQPQDGFLPLPAGPGLGVELNEEAVEKYRVNP